MTFLRMRLSTGLLVFACLTLPLVWHAAPDAKTAENRADIYWRFIIPLLIANWILVDARQRRQKTCYDYDAFQFWAWPLLSPIYLVRTRGWRALWPLLAVALLWVTVVLESAFLAAFLQK